ncbi:uncharacterized protein [Aphelocoma coerulescens]|uniref:uncharacterized protein isoform X1 n=1 Tax=Aphelocoma coerulescens TaxID=39617 RepID=UPI0036044018
MAPRLPPPGTPPGAPPERIPGIKTPPGTPGKPRNLPESPPQKSSDFPPGKGALGWGHGPDPHFPGDSQGFIPKNLSNKKFQRDPPGNLWDGTQKSAFPSFYSQFFPPFIPSFPFLFHLFPLFYSIFSLFLVPVFPFFPSFSHLFPLPPPILSTFSFPPFPSFHSPLFPFFQLFSPLFPPFPSFFPHFFPLFFPSFSHFFLSFYSQFFLFFPSFSLFFSQLFPFFPLFLFPSFPSFFQLFSPTSPTFSLISFPPFPSFFPDLFQLFLGIFLPVSWLVFFWESPGTTGILWDRSHSFPWKRKNPGNSRSLPNPHGSRCTSGIPSQKIPKSPRTAPEFPGIPFPAPGEFPEFLKLFHGFFLGFFQDLFPTGHAKNKN